MSYGVVYCVTNAVNGKKYVGQTTRSVEERWNDHKTDCKRRHYPFYSALRKYGTSEFQIEPLCECSSQKELDEKEIFYIGKLNTLYPFGYNCTEGGRGGMPSEETKRKISKSRKGKRSGVNHPFYGESHSKETIRKISESCKGKTVSEETKNKISKSMKGENHHMYGKSHSEETIKKMSKDYTLISPSGEVISITNMRKFCLENDYKLDHSAMCQVHSGRRKSYKGWTKYEGIVI